ncbi:TcmI family type II polyketide cyclase [Streptomyces sp. NPDC048172]|uniref:TcmI family type II polyketide cyclase n=1 Tax=Streptomyces sp. NPDC048172 TaxID=3365505 RepID=UPI00371152AE
MHTSLIIARHIPGSESEIARLFAESDASGLPEEIGVHTRKLYTFHDVYIHLVEAPAAVGPNVERNRDNPLFKDISKALDEYIRPYQGSWGSIHAASAKQFYQWERGKGVVPVS